MTERISHAAVRADNGAVFHLPRPNRHHDVMLWIRRAGRKPTRDQGFITSTGRFVDRVEALRIATESGQLASSPIAPPRLYSEDLW